MNLGRGDGNGRRAFVTGSTGFVGANLVRELLDRGWDVTAGRRPTSRMFRLSGLPIRLADVDILDPAGLERALSDGTDAVFHLAADLRLSDKATVRQIETNTAGTRNVLEASRSRRVKKVVMVSSMAAFGLHSVRIDERIASNAETVPIGYFRSKRLAEREAERAIDAGLDVTLINPSNVLGPFDTDNVPATFIRLVAASQMRFAGAGSASFCHARAISAAMVNAVDRGRTGHRYLLGGADASFVDLGALVAALTGGQAPSEVLPRYRTLADAECATAIAETYGYRFLTPEVALSVSHDMLVDDAKARRELGYAPSSLTQMICDEFNWLRDHRLLSSRALGRRSFGLSADVPSQFGQDP
jgi:nucleoside-diphosphate-sugar epimerase